MTTRAVRDRDLFKEVGKILGKWYDIPNEAGYRGTGAPGRLLEDLLQIKANNQDLPDAGRWELKYTGRKSHMTLFHKDPTPRRPSVVEALVRNCGWKGRSGHQSFRHTIWGESSAGFKISVSDEDVRVINSKYPEIIPKWDIDDLNNAAVTKLRNMIVVFGSTSKQGGQKRIIYKVAIRHSDFRFSEFLSGLKNRWICIDFDARAKNGGAIRNHGTKFRIKPQDLALLYKDTKRIEG